LREEHRFPDERLREEHRFPDERLREEHRFPDERLREERLFQPLVVRGAAPAARARFPIPLSIRACGFPAHGLPMIF
jgi:hypothetical protein